MVLKRPFTPSFMAVAWMIASTTITTMFGYYNFVSSFQSNVQQQQPQQKHKQRSYVLAPLSYLSYQKNNKNSKNNHHPKQHQRTNTFFYKNDNDDTLLLLSLLSSSLSTNSLMMMKTKLLLKKKKNTEQLRFALAATSVSLSSSSFDDIVSGTVATDSTASSSSDDDINATGTTTTTTTTSTVTATTATNHNMNNEETTESTVVPNVEPFMVGIVRDYRKRLPYYFNTDITDGISIQCIAATMFLFFACLAPAVGFGILYDKATAGGIGAVEVLSSTAGCGILYALTAAQPLTIIACTGPVLSFVAALAVLANNMGLPFLPLYAWTGLWTAGILLLSAVSSSSNMVKYLTRFTDEIFSLLISVIFVVNAFTDIGKVFATTSFTKALLTLVTASSTFLIAYTLKQVRQTVYFNKPIRRVVSSFAPTVGVLCGALIAKWAVRTQGAAIAALPALKMPSSFGTTIGRPWLVPIFDLPVWARWASFLPAIMAAVLLYFDQNITVRLVNNPKWKMVKGRRINNMLDGMHADMFVISILVAIQSLLGLPWLIASTVHSVAHVQALTNYDRFGSIINITEQRVTGTAIHALLACCVLFASPRLLLSQLSLPVFTGLFLYLGITGLSGNEMWERLIGLFKDKKFDSAKGRWYHTVPATIVNRYTLIQLVCLGVMYSVKESTQVGIFFPVVIAALAPIRLALEKTGIIPKKDIEILDEE